MKAVIQRLQARGVAGERVGIVELTQHIRAPCRRCGTDGFTTAPAFA